MRSITEVRAQIENAKWFASLGDFLPREGFVRISSLSAWANLPSPDEAIAEEMDWLPSSHTQQDPIHGESLLRRARAMGIEDEFKSARLSIVKATLGSLQKNMFAHPALRVGPHDFSNAARGAALFAMRMAASEIVVGESGFWCSLVTIYSAGNWPCGVLASGAVVVL